MEKKKFRDYFSLNGLPVELRNHFIIHLGLSSILFIVFGIMCLISHSTIMLYAMAIVLAYAAYKFYYLWQVQTDKILVYVGTLKEKTLKKHTIGFERKPLASMYGNSFIIVDIEGQNFRISVPYTFAAKEGDTIVFYVNPMDIFDKGDNTFAVENVLLIKYLKN